MKQLLILSGKGGTGKTTVAGAFVKLAEAKAFADCDVDAPNLHLVTDISRHQKPAVTDFYGLSKAVIDKAICIECGSCVEACRFKAIADTYRVDPLSCEGCSLCFEICPVHAITMEPHISGELHLYADDKQCFSTAALHTGSGNSGLLVTEVKKQLKNNAPDADIAIIDGSPGIGCPVIASLTGIDIVLIVAEPSVSGISDMERVIQTARGLGVSVVVCVNKYDVHQEKTNQIMNFCQTNQIPFVGKIPYDSEALKAINQGKSIIEYPCAAEKAVRTVYENVLQELQRQGDVNNDKNSNSQ